MSKRVPCPVTGRGISQCVCVACYCGRRAKANARHRSKRVELNAKRRARRATERALYASNAPRVTRYGAPMGRSGFGGLPQAMGATWRDEAGSCLFDPTVPVRIARVTGHDGGDYDREGTYWGGLWHHPLFWLYQVNDGKVVSEHFLRAGSREAVKVQLREKIPGVKLA